MKIITWISRILVGSLFIVSGLIKANDPLGFGYKLQDYYLVFAEHLGFFNSPLFMNTAVELSVLICIIEVVLGIALLFGTRMRLVVPILLLMMVFFTFLTGFSHYTGQVTDCGCFGDALKITPKESFYKDIVLLVLILPLFIWRGKIYRNSFRDDLVALPIAQVLIAVFSFGVISWGFPVWMSLVVSAIILGAKKLLESRKGDWAVAGISVLSVLAFSLYCINHLPIRDFRPYQPGSDVCALREGIPDKRKFFYVLKNKETGEIKEFEDWPENWKDSWEYVEPRSVVVEKGEKPKIHISFSSEEGNNVTEEFLEDPGYKFLVVMYNIDKTKTNRFDEVNALQKAAEERRIAFIGASASGQETVEVFRHEQQAAFPIYQADETELKTIVRSNPGIVLMKGCEVVDKWHWRDTPDMESLQDQLK